MTYRTLEIELPHKDYILIEGLTLQKLIAETMAWRDRVENSTGRSEHGARLALDKVARFFGWDAYSLRDTLAKEDFFISGWDMS